MNMFHIVYEDGYWSLWQDGRIVGRFHTKEEAYEGLMLPQG